MHASVLPAPDSLLPLLPPSLTTPSPPPPSPCPPGDGVVDSEDAELAAAAEEADCPDGTVLNDGQDPSTNLRCISGASGVFSVSSVAYAGVLGAAVAAGMLAL